MNEKDLSVFSEPQLALSKNKMKQNECNSNFVSGSFSEAQPIFYKDSASRENYKMNSFNFVFPRRCLSY